MILKDEQLKGHQAPSLHCVCLRRLNRGFLFSIRTKMSIIEAEDENRC